MMPGGLHAGEAAPGNLGGPKWWFRPQWGLWDEFTSCPFIEGTHCYPMPPEVSDFLWVKHDYTDRVCGPRAERKKDFQKHVCEEKARHTLRRDPVGSWEDKVYQCTGSFLSCWSTCDSAHSAHSAPDTRQHLATAQGTHSVSNAGHNRPLEQELRELVLECPGLPPHEWPW